MKRPLGLIGLVVAVVLGLTACGPTFTSLPLPGSGVSGDTITVKADFDNALNLAQGAAVRINGVMSGRVKSVTASNFKARVTMAVQKSAHLRADAVLRLRYTTPLGELYVEVTNPSQGALMSDGGTMAEETSTAPTVEDALAQASLLINGGGLNQLTTIVNEANKALGGHEENIRSLITQTSQSLTQIYAARGDIDRALNALNSVSQALGQRRAIIHSALQDIAPAADALHENTENITALLTSLDRFAATANTAVGANKKQILKIVRQAQPVLQELVKVRGQLAPTLNAILSLAKSLNVAVPGDYLNLFVVLHLDSLATGLLGSLAPSSSGTTGSKTTGKKTATNSGGLLGGLSSLLQQGTSKKPGKSSKPGLLSGIPIIGGIL